MPTVDAHDPDDLGHLVRATSRGSVQTSRRWRRQLGLPQTRHRGQVFILAMLMGATAGCGGSAAHSHRVASPGSTTPSHQVASTPFAFNSSRPLRFVDRGRINHGYPIAVHDISYTSGRDRIAAFLVLPPGRRKSLPAVVYLHGTGGDRTELVVPSTWLVSRGAIALVLTAPSTVTPLPSGISGLAFLRWQVQMQARDVIAVRRGIDLLVRRQDVDPKRIGFVGWSAGAHTGAILAGIEPRLRALVLMSGGVVPVSAYAALARPALRAPIARYLGSIDPLRYLPRAQGALFLQDGRRDRIVPRAALLTFARAAPAGTRVRWYEAGHALDDAAYRAQLTWLAQELQIRGPVVAGARTGP